MPSLSPLSSLVQNGIVVFSRCFTGREGKRKKNNNKKPNYAYSGTGDEVLTILAMA